VPSVHPAQVFEAEEGLNLAHHLAASGLGFENLPEETLAGQAQAKDALAAVLRRILLGEEMEREDAFQILLQLSQGSLAHLWGGGTAARSQPGTELGEERGVHRAVYIPPY
jgi:hypothetical protein